MKMPSGGPEIQKSKRVRRSFTGESRGKQRGQDSFLSVLSLTLICGLPHGLMVEVSPRRGAVDSIRAELPNGLPR